MLLPRRDVVLDEARATTRQVARTFALACRLLPGAVRDDVYRLYLVFCTLDDLVDDGVPGAEERVAAVERWARGGPPRSPETLILEELAGRRPIPRTALFEFSQGMRHDLERRAIVTEEELDAYCYRVAGTVGIVMAAVLGTRWPADREAAALGMAMQRTNVLRDIDEDLACGRRYMALESVERYGSPAPGMRDELLRDGIARADDLYEEGLRGIPALVHGGRAVAVAAGLYREILRQIEREGYGRRPGRAVVGRPRKLVVAVRHGLIAGQAPRARSPA